MTLPRLQESTRIALRVIETRKLPHHDKVLTPLGAKAHEKKKAGVRFDACKLWSEEIRRRYNTEVKNMFEVQGDIEYPEEENDKILVMYRDAAEKVSASRKSRANHE